MVHASNPRLMNRVLDAVVHLCEGKGSTARDVLDFLRQTSKSTPRNLTMQVHRALKHAVKAGLLRHRSGRYKALFTLNPAPDKQHAIQNNDENSAEGTSTFDAQQPPSKRTNSEDRDENRGKRKKQRRERKRKRSRSRQRRRRRRSGSRRHDKLLKHMGEIRKLKYKEKEERDRSPRHRTPDSGMKADIGNAPGSSSNGKRSKARAKDKTYYSDLSDSSDYEDRKARVKRKTPTRQECKHDGSGKSNRRSISRNRSPQRQQSQQLQLKHTRDNDKSNQIDPDNCRNMDRENVPDQVTEKDHEPNNSESGSTL